MKDAGLSSEEINIVKTGDPGRLRSAISNDMVFGSNVVVVAVVVVAA